MGVEFGGRYRALLAGLSIAAGIALGLAVGLAPPEMPTSADVLTFLVYAGLLTIAQTFPVRLGDQSISIALGIEVPLFLQFGPVPTVLTLLSTWFLSQWILGRSLWTHRTMANFSVFTLIVLAAAGAYHLSGGTVPFNCRGPLLPLVGPVMMYVTVHFSTNYFLTTLLEYTHGGGEELRWTANVMWDLAAFLIEILIAWTMILTYHDFGALSLVLVAFPFIGLLYVFRLYSTLIMANRQFSVISELTVKLSVELHEDGLLKVLLDGIPRLITTTACYVFLPDEGGWLSPRAVRGPGPEIEERMLQVRVEPGCGVTGTAYRRGSPLVANSPREERIADRPYASPLPTVGASVMAVPLRYNDQTLGVLTLTHTQKQAYSRRDLQMMSILAAQVAIGLWNAKRFALTEEQTFIDQLTGMYNYRYFETALEEWCKKADQEAFPLTLLVMDLDHFKTVNDSYGHLAGNEALRAVSQLIREEVREEDIVCRYGGEEFAVILPRTTLETAMHIAERLRRAIEATPIVLPGHGNATPLPIRLTISVGAATYPLMADSPPNLLRNADRAMYVGSKQKGRNRVAAYEY